MMDLLTTVVGRLRVLNVVGVSMVSRNIRSEHLVMLLSLTTTKKNSPMVMLRGELIFYLNIYSDFIECMDSNQVHVWPNSWLLIECLCM